MDNAAGGKTYPPKGGFGNDGTITKVSDGTFKGTGSLDADKDRAVKSL